MLNSRVDREQRCLTANACRPSDNAWPPDYFTPHASSCATVSLIGGKRLRNVTAFNTWQEESTAMRGASPSSKCATIIEIRPSVLIAEILGFVCLRSRRPSIHESPLIQGISLETGFSMKMPCSIEVGPFCHHCRLSTPASPPVLVFCPLSNNRVDVERKVAFHGRFTLAVVGFSTGVDFSLRLAFEVFTKFLWSVVRFQAIHRNVTYVYAACCWTES